MTEENLRYLNQIVDLKVENAALRKALEGAPHANLCGYWDYVARPEDGAWQHKPCDCWKARIPLATDETLAQGRRLTPAGGKEETGCS